MPREDCREILAVDIQYLQSPFQPRQHSSRWAACIAQLGILSGQHRNAWAVSLPETCYFAAASGGLMLSSSTSKISVAPGPISGP